MGVKYITMKEVLQWKVQIGMFSGAYNTEMYIYLTIQHITLFMVRTIPIKTPMQVRYVQFSSFGLIL